MSRPHNVRLSYAASLSGGVLSEDEFADRMFRYVDISSVKAERGIVGSQVLRFGEAPSRARRTVELDDVIVSTVRTHLGSIALIGREHTDSIVSTGFAVLRPVRTRVRPRFLYMAVTERGFRASVVAHSLGVSYPAIAARRLVRLPIPLPGITDQDVLLAFLEREDERIGAVRAKLAAVADRALEPALARAEQAWVDQPLGKIGYRFEVQLGKKLYESRIEHATAMPYLRNANVHWDRFALDDVKVMNFEGAEVAMYALRPGDLLVCEGGEPGRSAVWDGQIAPCFFQMALNRVRPRGLDSTRWVMWALRSLARTRGFTSDGPGRYLHVTAEQLRATRIPLPSPEVQHRLVAEIDAEADRARRLSGLAGRLDERLAEYRDALITAAVHGRLELSRVSEAELDERLHAATEDLVP